MTTASSTQPHVFELEALVPGVVVVVVLDEGRRRRTNVRGRRGRERRGGGRRRRRRHRRRGRRGKSGCRHRQGRGGVLGGPRLPRQGAYHERYSGEGDDGRGHVAGNKVHGPAYGP